MTVIKNDKAADVLPRAMVLDLSDLAGQAKQMMEQARADAQRIREEAERDAEQRRAAASDEGYKQGFEKGEAAGTEAGRNAARNEVLGTFRPQLDQLTESWSEALQHWEQSRNDMLLQAREDVLTFAFELASNVIGRAIEHDPSVVQDQVAEALALLNQPTAVTIITHPDDRALIEEVLPKLLEQMTSCANAELRSDEQMTRGGCIVRTAGGSVDATIETQLARIAETLLPHAKAKHAHSQTAKQRNGDEADV